MDCFNEAADALNKLERDLGEEATPDQRIAMAQVWATLSVAQELSSIAKDGVTVVLDEDAPHRP